MASIATPIPMKSSRTVDVRGQQLRRSQQDRSAGPDSPRPIISRLNEAATETEPEGILFQAVGRSASAAAATKSPIFRPISTPHARPQPSETGLFFTGIGRRLDQVDE